MTQAYQIAIDGPSGAGKSSVAKKLAARLNIDYIDTGAMYRAVAYKMLREGIGIEDREALKAMLENIHIDFSRGETILDDEVISEKIRTPEISKLASDAVVVVIYVVKLMIGLQFIVNELNVFAELFLAVGITDYAGYRIKQP